MKLVTTAILFILACLCSACNKFEYSPYQSKTTEDMPGNVNAVNLAKLMAASGNSDDTVTIAFTGDCQRFYDRLDGLVKKVNTIPNIDFLIMAGDIADFGVLKEYLWINERLQKLYM